MLFICGYCRANILLVSCLFHVLRYTGSVCALVSCEYVVSITVFCWKSVVISYLFYIGVESNGLRVKESPCNHDGGASEELA